MNRKDELSDAEYEIAIEHAAQMALIFRYGPDTEEVASFPWWKRHLHDCLPRKHRWKLSWASVLIKDFNERVGYGK